MVLNDTDYRLIEEIQGGLPLTSRPFAAIGERIELREEEVIARIAAMQIKGFIKRLGIVLHHRELGYTSNAMVVWDVPNQRLDEIGRKIGSQECVTLCYQRPRQPPDWPYNLFCMIHGKQRKRVLNYIDVLVEDQGLQNIPHRVLFSNRRFKQCGARYQ